MFTVFLLSNMHNLQRCIITCQFVVSMCLRLLHLLSFIKNLRLSFFTRSLRHGFWDWRRLFTTQIWFLHLFELDETFFAADVFSVWSVLHLLHDSSVEVDGAADVAHQQRQVVDFVVADEAGVAAKSMDHAIQGQLELALRITYSSYVRYCAEGLGTLDSCPSHNIRETFNWLNINSAAWQQEIVFFVLNFEVN